MTFIALRRRTDMTGWFSGRGGAVVAGGARTGGYVDMIENRRHPTVGGMAVIAAVVARNVVGRLARCGGAVVTAEAAAQYSGMIDPDYRGPDIGAVTVLAQIGGLDVATGLGTMAPINN